MEVVNNIMDSSQFEIGFMKIAKWKEDSNHILFIQHRFPNTLTTTLAINLTTTNHTFSKHVDGINEGIKGNLCYLLLHKVHL